MNDSAPASAPDATGGRSELDRLREANRGKGLLIERSSIGGYAYKVIRGTTTRHCTDAADAQRVINQDFR